MFRRTMNGGGESGNRRKRFRHHQIREAFEEDIKVSDDDDEEATFAPWDIFSVKEISLLEDASWTSAEVLNARALYNTFQNADGSMSLEGFQEAFAPLTLSDVQTRDYFRAFCVQGPGLSCSQFVLGLAAMSPSTPHQDNWAIERYIRIFRLYNRSQTGCLEHSELRELLHDMTLQQNDDTAGEELIGTLMADITVCLQSSRSPERLGASSGPTEDGLFHILKHEPDRLKAVAVLFRLAAGAVSHLLGQQNSLIVRELGVEKNGTVGFPASEGIRHDALLRQPLCRSAGFTSAQLDELFARYKSAVQPENNDGLDLPAFRSFANNVASGSFHFGASVFRSFDTNYCRTLSFEDVVLGFSAMSPGTPNSDSRLRYVFRQFAVPATSFSPATIKFPQFVKLVRQIHELVGERPTDERSVHESAKEVFIRSGLDPDTGFVTESVFVAASLNSGGFRGTEGLFRLKRPLFPLCTNEDCNVGPVDLKNELNQGTKSSASQVLSLCETSDTDVDPIADGGTGGRCGSPVPEEGATLALSPGSIQLSTPSSGREFHVSIDNTVVFDKTESGAHKLSTTRKIARFDLQLPPPGNLLDVDVGLAIDRILKVVLDRTYAPPPAQLFGFPPFDLASEVELSAIFAEAEKAVAADAMVVEVLAPVRIFGDIHGQLPDLLHFFHTYGVPNHKNGDVHLVNYIFIGDFVDRGSYSLEVLATLFCLKLRYPQNVFLIRGNHEDREVNERFGFKSECVQRLGKGTELWEAANVTFDSLPVAALVESKVICLHGGIGKTLATVEQIRRIPRPVRAPVQGPYADLMRDILWSDPTEHDTVVGIQGNIRGDDMVEFGPDRVLHFLAENDLELVVRAHQCVMGGYEFFASQHLVTVFSATNYCGRHDNDGAIITISRSLKVAFHVITYRERRSFSMWSQPQNSTPPRERKRLPLIV